MSELAKTLESIVGAEHILAKRARAEGWGDVGGDFAWTRLQRTLDQAVAAVEPVVSAAVPAVQINVLAGILCPLVSSTSPPRTALTRAPVSISTPRRLSRFPIQPHFAKIRDP